MESLLRPSRRTLLRAGTQLATLLAVSGVSARASFAADPKSENFPIISHVYNLRNVYWSNWEKGAAEAGKALNMRLQVEVDDQNNDKLQTIFRTAKSRGFKGITSCVADPGITPSILRTAQNDGIYVANGWNLEPWLSPFDIGDYFYSFSTPNDVAGAYALAKMLFDKMGGKGDIIHIAGIPGSTVAINRALGLDKALKEYPDIKLVARQPGGDDRGKTVPVINALLTAHPNAKAVFCQNDDTAMGVLSALQARGKKDILVTGIDGIPDFLDAIADGRAFATWAHHGAYMGARVTVQVFDALAGIKPLASERMMYSGGFLLNTPDAAKTYKETMFGEGGLPYDFTLMSKALNPDNWDPQNTLAPMDFEDYFERQKPRPQGYKTPQAFADAKANGEFEKVAQTYRDHFKKDPLANIRKMVVNGGEDIV